MNINKIIDEKTLKDSLQECEIPKPSTKAKTKALSMAMDAFDAELQENENKLQGLSSDARLKEVSGKKTRKNKPFYLWRNIMKKKFIIGGLSGAVAVCALLVMLGGPSEVYRQALNSGSQDASSNLHHTTISNITYGGNKITSGKMDITISKKDYDRPSFANTTEAMVSSSSPSILERVFRKEKSRAMAKKPIVSRDFITQMPQSSIYMPPTTHIDSDDIITSNYKEVGEDEFKDFKDNSVKTVSTEPVSTFSIDVDTASYSFMRRMINAGKLPQKDAVRVEEMINYFNYDYSLPENKTQPFQPTIAVYDSPWKVGNKIIHIGIKGHDIKPAEKPKANLVFLLDTSGSMNSQDKLPLLINSMKMLVENLDSEDTVAIVTYAGSAGTVLEPTKVSEKYKIISTLENLRSGGSTAGAAGITQAYNLIDQNFDKNGVNRVILATDGDFNVGIRNHQELQDFVERKRDSGVFLSVLGFGQGNYHDNLMQTLAQNGNGNAAYIDTLSEARKVLVDEARSTLFTIAKDVKIQVEFNPKMVSEYRLIGYETRALNREDFNNDAIDAGEIGSGHSVTAIYEITPTDAPQNRLIDDLKYGTATTNIPVDGSSAEYANLKIRYKLPNENKSKLITRPITLNDLVAEFDTMSDDIRFASAVAAFSQKLRGGKYLNNMKYDTIIDIAKSAKGDDDFGYRAEFVNLVRLAKSIK